MKSESPAVLALLEQIPEEKRGTFEQVRKVILTHLPQGFTETISYGMLSYVVPHALYPKGYHCNPKEPLPFISLAAQKQYIALHHMGMYANQDLLAWFKEEYPRHSKKKLDMGKACVRLKDPNAIPYELIGQLVEKLSVDDWIRIYESMLNR